jgi:hypothetical protein
MRNIFITGTTIIFLLFAASPVHALRCGNKLVSKGDFKFEVVNKCGEPNSHEVVGYTINKYQKQELIIEHLVFGPWNKNYYVLTFIGGKLTKIEAVKEE